MNEPIDWKARAEAAEAKVEQMREALQQNSVRWKERECLCDPDRFATQCHRCHCVEVNHAAISTPAQPVVDREKAQQIVEAFQIYVHEHGPVECSNCNERMEKALALARELGLPED